jgi:hypothetical protein
MNETPDEADTPFDWATEGRRRRRRRPARKKWSLRTKLIVAALIAVPTLFLLTCAGLGFLIMYNDIAVTGRWVADPEPGDPVPAELRGAWVDLHGDGETCVVSTGGIEYQSRWEAEPYGSGVAATVLVYEPRTRGMTEFKLRRAGEGRLELFDPQTPGRQVRMKRSDPQDRQPRW